jgi:hypothetical protein
LAKFGLNLRILEIYLYGVVFRYFFGAAQQLKFKIIASFKAARPLKIAQTALDKTYFLSYLGIKFNAVYIKRYISTTVNFYTEIYVKFILIS